jgi:hypothetical protein
MVRTSFLNEIHNAISATNFLDVIDFDIVTEEKQSYYYLLIKYKYATSFCYAANIPTSGDDITFTSCPGEINKKESGKVSSKYGLSRSISEWLGRVKEELLAIPVHRQADEQRRVVEEMLNRLQNVEDVAFTREEAEELRVELDKLKQQMINHIKASTQSQAEQNAKIQTISNDVDALKANVDILNKPNWARAAISRLYKWSRDPENRGLIKDSVEVATKLLSGHINGH